MNLLNMFRQNFFHARKFSILFLFLVISLGAILRFYKLNSTPPGLYPDETAIGYNAYSVLETGKDEFGKSFPLYYRSYDDYKMPVYMYATALSIKMFGLNAFSVRLLSALIGTLAIPALYFLVLELSKKKSVAYLSALFLTLNPWHLFFSRVGYEVNVATTLLVVGTLFFIMAAKRKNNMALFVLSILAFIISIYTYNVTRLIAPLLFLCLSFSHFRKAENRKNLYIILTLFFVGMLPFFISFISLQSESGFSSQKDALIIGNVTKAEFLQTRSYFIGLPSIFQKIFYNYWLFVAWTYMKNLVDFFSTSFFFTFGTHHPHENIGGGLGMFYYFDFPLILLGAYYGIKKRVTALYPFYLWFLLIFFVGSIIVAVPNGTRTYHVVIPFVVFAAYGAYELGKLILKIKKNYVKRLATLGVILLISYSMIFYLTSYFFRFPLEYAKEWRSEDQKGILFIRSVEEKYNKIIFDDSAEFIYTSLLFYGKYPPAFYQQNATYEPRGLVVGLSKVGKYEFRKVNWEADTKEPNVLLVVGPNENPQGVRLLATFTYPTRPVAFYYDRKISQLPATDTAFRIYESKGIGTTGLSMGKFR